MLLSGRMFNWSNRLPHPPSIEVPAMARSARPMRFTCCLCFPRRVFAPLLFGVLMLSFLLSGCASYKAGYRDRALPGGYTLIAVPVFKNLTIETGAEVYFTDALIRELARSHVGRITNKAESQVVLEGVVERIEYLHGPQYTNTQLPAAQLPANTVINTAYRIRVFTRMTLRRTSDREILWANQFELERTYNSPIIGLPGLNSANATYNQSARNQNLQVMAQELMAEAHDRMTENFW